VPDVEADTGHAGRPGFDNPEFCGVALNNRIKIKVNKVEETDIR